MGRRLFTGFSTQNVVPGSTKTTLYDLNLVKSDLMNRFMTRKGERVMLPGYGTDIFDRLFEPFTDAIKSTILQDVLDVINSEPRVTMQDIDVYQTEQGIAISVSLFYIPWKVIDTLQMAFDAENITQN